MKIDFIRTYQSGGGVYVPPYVTYQPLPQASEAVSTSGKSSDDEKGLTEKDLASLLKDYDGLPSDMAVIQSRLRSFFSSSTRSALSSGTANIASTYVKILGLIKRANYNKEEYDNAYDQVSKNGGINELAINDRGQFVCTNGEGDFKFMTADQLKKSLEEDEGYMPLTNSELLYYRAQDVSLANNNRLLSVVQNGIGMEVVTEMIQKALNGLASSEVSQEGYVSTRAGKLLQGLEDFQKAVQDASGSTYDGTVDDLYKYKYLTRDQAKQAEEAFAYIYSTLPTNAKALLKAKSDLTEEGAQKLVQSLVAARMDTKQTFDLDLEGGVSNRTTKNAGASDNNDLRSTWLVTALRGQSGDPTSIKIDSDTGIEMVVSGEQYYNPRDSKSDEPVATQSSLLTMLRETGLLDVAQRDAITFGDQQLSAEALANVAYLGRGAMRAILPCKPDGTVNLELLQKYEEAEAKLDSLGHEPTAEENRSIAEEAGLTQLLGADGKWDKTKFNVFFLIDGLTTDKLAGLQKDKFLHELSRVDARTAVPLLQRCLAVDKSKPDIDRKNALAPADLFSTWYDHIYKGVVFVPVNVDMLGAAIASNQRLKIGEASNLEALKQHSEQRRTLKTTSSDVLGL